MQMYGNDEVRMQSKGNRSSGCKVHWSLSHLIHLQTHSWPWKSSTFNCGAKDELSALCLKFLQELTKVQPFLFIYLFFYLFVLVCNINLNHKLLLESVFLVLICKKKERVLVFSNHRVKEGLSLWDMLLIIRTQPPITMSGLETTLSWTISFILPFKLNVQQFVLNSFPVYWKCLRLLAT